MQYTSRNDAGRCDIACARDCRDRAQPLIRVRIHPRVLTTAGFSFAHSVTNTRKRERSKKEGASGARASFVNRRRLGTWHRGGPLPRYHLARTAAASLGESM